MEAAEDFWLLLSDPTVRTQSSEKEVSWNTSATKQDWEMRYTRILQSAQG